MTDLRLSNKNILMILDGNFPGDLRVDKEVKSLTEAGAMVVVVCYRKEGQPTVVLNGAVQVLRTRRVVTTSVQGMIDIYTSLTGTNLLLRSVLKSVKMRIDAVHVHDIPSWMTARWFAKSARVPLVLDLHENYPEGVKTWFSWRTKPLIRLKNKLFFSYNHWLKREHTAVLHSDRIITVVEEMRDRIVQAHAVDADIVTVVRNSEPRNLFSNDGQGDAAYGASHLELVYVGGIGPHRGLDTALQGMPAILKQNPQIRLVMVGTGNAETMNFLKNLVIKLGVSAHVEFTGQVPPSVARKRMQGALLNIIPHHSNGQNESGLPHKLFQIFLSRYPLLVSSCKPLQRIVGDNGAGLVFKAGDPVDFAEKVLWAADHQPQLSAFADKAFHLAMHEGYNWETDGERLVNLYADLLVGR